MYSSCGAKFNLAEALDKLARLTLQPLSAACFALTMTYPGLCRGEAGTPTKTQMDVIPPS